MSFVARSGPGPHQTWPRSRHDPVQQHTLQSENIKGRQKQCGKVHRHSLSRILFRSPRSAISKNQEWGLNYSTGWQAHSDLLCMCLTGPTPLVWSCCAIAAAVSEHLTITGSPREHPSLSWRAQGGRGTASADHRGTWREMPGACQPLPSQEQRHSDGSSQFTQQAGQGDTHCKEILILIHTAQPTDATYVCYMYATSNSHEKNNIQTAPCSYTWGALRLANCWGSSIHSTLTCSFPCWGHLSKPRWTPAASCTC